MIGVPRLITVLTTSLIGATIALTQTAAAGPDAASDSQIDRRVRTFRADLDKDSSPFFWDLLPGPQVRAISTGLQAKMPVDLSGVTIAEKTITEHGRNIKLYIVKPEKADATTSPTVTRTGRREIGPSRRRSEILRSRRRDRRRTADREGAAGRWPDPALARPTVTAGFDEIFWGIGAIQKSP